MAPTQHFTNGASAVRGNSATNLMNKTSTAKKSTTGADSISSNSSLGLEGKTFNMEWPGMQDCLLPIATRGLFQDDVFFEDARKNYNQAVTDVLDKFGQRSDQVDDMTSYRQMREFDLQDRNQAVSVIEDEKNHKVALDVRDFMKGDVKVKVIDENELVVEGSCEKQDGGCVSKQSFKRSFTFPGLVKADAVTSAMSSDGVLTVSVPKGEQGSIPASQKSNSHITSTNVNTTAQSMMPAFEKDHMFSNDDFFTSARQNFENAFSGVNSFRDTSFANKRDSFGSLGDRHLVNQEQEVTTSEDDHCHKVLIDVREYMHNDLQVKFVDENELVVEGNLKKEEGGSVSTRKFSRRFVFPGLVNAEAVSSKMSADGKLVITVPKIEKPKQSFPVTQNTSNSVKSSTYENDHNVSNQSMQNGKTANNSIFHENDFDHHISDNFLQNRASDDDFSLSNMTNDFHNDFFAKARQEFENMRVFNHSNELTSHANDMNFFRDLHRGVPHRVAADEGKQSESITEDDKALKVEIDVRDFVGGNLQVKALEQNELLVEGRQEIDDQGRTSSKSFSRRVQLPGAVRVNDITSVLTKDGILVITAPKESGKQTHHHISSTFF